MSAPILNSGPIVLSHLRGLIDNSLDDLASKINKVQVGRIVAFDPGPPATVQVQLVLQRQVWNNVAPAAQQSTQGGTGAPIQPTILAYPALFKVPLWTPMGGAAVLTMPIAAGDFALVLFNDRDLDPWLTTGGVGSPPNDTRMHSLSDAIALVGLTPFNAGVAGWDPAKAQLRNGTSGISVGPKIGIYNAVTSLKLVIDTLVTVLLNTVQTDGSTPNAATIIAINALKILGDSLLE